MTWAYYNDNEPYVAQWLRNFIAAGEIPPGDVDERDIREVRAEDLEGYGQVHFFAGIAGWPLALKLAGWPDDRPVWTGSCPCQPLSSAGQRKGHADERHLWPAFYALIAECRPATILGEQVASKDGREWLAGVRADLEALGYAVGAADLPAACIGSPQIRQRLWFVAYSHRASKNKWASGRKQSLPDQNDANSETVGSTARQSAERRRQPWKSAITIRCDDGSRRIEPGALALAQRIPRRMDKIRAYGNTIVPPLAAEFIHAVMETI